MSAASLAPRISLVLDRLRIVEQLIPRDAAEALDELGYALLELEELLDELRAQEPPR